MLCFICENNKDMNTSTVCNAAHKDDVDNKKGRFIVSWRSGQEPILGHTYSIIPKINWNNIKGKQILLHGFISNNTPIEERSTYEVNNKYNTKKTNRR